MLPSRPTDPPDHQTDNQTDDRTDTRSGAVLGTDSLPRVGRPAGR